MTPEEEARQKIDRQLEHAGWAVQDYRQMNISASLGVAVREFPLTTGDADYMLYADAKAIGVVEAKPEGHTPTGVETQSGKYVGLASLKKQQDDKPSAVSRIPQRRTSSERPISPLRANCLLLCRPLNSSPNPSGSDGGPHSRQAGPAGPLIQENSPKLPPSALGFRQGSTSVHTSRTIMLGELSMVLDRVQPTAKRDDYTAAIIEENTLGKPTQTTRQRSAKRLTELYSLDPNCTLFRLLRHFWPADQAGRPMLAFLTAAARDPLLRETTPFVQGIAAAEAVDARLIGEHLKDKYPARFSPTTLHSTAQNLASSWTQAGYLTGKVKKNRSKPTVTPAVASFAVLLGYLCGLRGKLLLDSIWTRLLDLSPAALADLVIEASRQGWLTYKAAGGVVEITFPGLLRPQEEKAAHD